MVAVSTMIGALTMSAHSWTINVFQKSLLRNAQEVLTGSIKATHEAFETFTRGAHTLRSTTSRAVLPYSATKRAVKMFTQGWRVSSERAASRAIRRGAPSLTRRLP